MTIQINGTTGISGVDGSAATPALQGTDSNTGIHFPAADTVAIDTGGSERVRCDSSGRLLVGTSSALTNIKRYAQSIAPTQQIISNDTANWNTGLGLINYSASGYAPVLTLGLSASNTAGTNTLVSNSDRCGVITFNGNDGTDFEEAARIEAFVDGTPGANDMPGRLVFSTTADGASSPTERMRISQNGNVDIGGTGSSGWRLFVQGSNTTDTTYATVMRNSATTDLFILRNDGGFGTGNAAASPYNSTTASGANVFVNSSGYLQRSTSSARYKKDIETLENQYADAILNARPVWYKSIASGDVAHPDWGYWGFIAEEVAEIDPRLVFWKTHETEKDEDGNTVQVELEEPIAEGVQYDRFVPHLLNLIKRQGEAIAELQAEVAALKGA